MHEVAEQVLGYIRASLAYRWYAIGFAWIAAIAGWIFVYQLPNRYEASARVFVDTQSVLRPLLAGLAIQPNVDQVVAMMSRTLISRPNLEKVVRMADLDVKARTPKEREELIAELARLLSIRSAGGENLYTIAYSEENPQVAKQVVQSLLTIFVEGSLVDKRKDTDSARRFIEDQLKSYADKLSVAEKAMVEFKQRNMGLMGNVAAGYYNRLSEASSQMEQAKLALREAENRRDAIRKQQSGEEEPLPSLLPSAPLAEAPEQPGVIRTQFDSRIEALQQKLDQLRLAYTERHPDIIAANRMLADLKQQHDKEVQEKQRELEQRRRELAKVKKAAPAAPVLRSQSAASQLLVSQLTEAEAQVASLKVRVAEYEKRYADLRAAASSVPQVETEYTQLTRDYEVTRRNYEALLTRRESAQISGEMEASTNVVDFRVIDPPQVPSKPSWPPRPRFMSLVLFAALGGGFGLAFLLSQIWPTVRDERQLRESTGLPVLGTVVMAWTPEQRSKRRRGLLGLVASLVSLLSAYAAVMVAVAVTAARA